jgi:hypothetical protein
MAKPIIFDVETKYSFRQFADPAKLGISVVVIYDYEDGKYHSFREEDLPQLFPRLHQVHTKISCSVLM